PRFAMPSARAISIMDVHMSRPPTSPDACRRRRTPCSSHPLRAPDRGQRLREGAERSEAPRRGDGDPGASANALASNPLPWWETLTMDVSLWGTFYGNRTTRDGRRSPAADPASLDDPCTALYIIDRAPKPRTADG